MSERQHDTDQPRGIDHNRIDQLTKEYRLELEADPHDPIAAKAQEESAQWAEQVRAGRYPEHEKRRHQDLKAIREKLYAGDGHTEPEPHPAAPRPDDTLVMSALDHDPAVALEANHQPTAPLRALDRDKLARLDAERDREQAARESNVAAMFRDPAEHPGSERLARPDEIQAAHARAVGPQAPARRPSPARRAARRVRSWLQMLSGRS